MAAQHPNHADLLVAYLAGADVACPLCGYNLRGLKSGTCPECNEDITLRVGLSEPRIGAYIGALAGHLAGAGGAAVCLVLVAAMTMRYGSGPGGSKWFAVYVLPWIALVVQGGSAALLGRVRGRRWFRLLGAGARGWVIASGWVMIAGFVAWFLARVM